MPEIVARHLSTQGLPRSSAIRDQRQYLSIVCLVQVCGKLVLVVSTTHVSKSPDARRLPPRVLQILWQGYLRTIRPELAENELGRSTKSSDYPLGGCLRLVRRTSL